MYYLSLFDMMFVFLSITEPENQRMGWVGRDLRDHPVPTPALGRDDIHSIRLPRAPCPSVLLANVYLTYWNPLAIFTPLFFFSFFVCIFLLACTFYLKRTIFIIFFLIIRAVVKLYQAAAIQIFEKELISAQNRSCHNVTSKFLVVHCVFFYAHCILIRFL